MILEAPYEKAFHCMYNCCSTCWRCNEFSLYLHGQSLKILKKADLTFEDTFVDARGAKKLMLYMKPSLLKAGIKDVLENQITSDDK